MLEYNRQDYLENKEEGVLYAFDFKDNFIIVFD